ncbi:MAG: phosphoenolpyruvate carboxylase [Myxococcota bacterium]
MDDRAFVKSGSSLRFLMQTFADVLNASGHQAVARMLPWPHLWGGDGTPTSEFPDEIAERCVQAYSLAFQLADQAEENAMTQSLRAFEDEGRLDEESGSWEKMLALLKELGHDEARIAEELRQLHVEPVLTAHPTEAKRQTILEHQRSLHRLLVALENSMWTKAERADIEYDLKAEIDRLWRTGEIYLEKPSLIDERRMVLHYLRHVFPEVVPRFERRVRTAWQSAGFDDRKLTDPESLPRVAFGNWVGGDRDGHPFVTAEFTEDTLLLFRKSALELIDQGLERLAIGMSLSENRQKTPPALLERVRSWRTELGSAGEAAVARNPDEPWRQYVNLLRAALPRQSAPAPGQFIHASELLRALRTLQSWLREANVPLLAERDIHPVISLVRVFGFHLAVVDIRQNSAYHDKALAQLLTLARIERGEEYAEWSLEERRALLEREVSSPRPFGRPEDLKDPDGQAEARAMVDLYERLARHVRRFGTEGLGGLIVSMTRSAEDLLAVYVLAREGGLIQRDAGGPYIPLTVVPLLETIDDLQRAPEIMDRYLSYPIVKASLERQAQSRGDAIPVQQVMVGYSDSCKDGGIVASMWSLNRCQSELNAIADRHGVLMRYFHGRGGTIGRGAGPTHRFVRAMPPGALRTSLRVTEQGETIRQKYANPATAAHHLELLSASLLGRRALDASGAFDPPELVQLMDELCRISRQAYEQLIRADGFVAFFERATPVDAIENSRIGSRPARRPGERKLSNLRAIPWVFAWNQARFVLPGWYGLGSGLMAIKERDENAFEALRRAKSEAHRWAPFHYLVSNAATAVATASPPLMERYAALANEVPEAGTLFAQVMDEYQRTQTALELIYGAPLAISRPNIHRLITLRSEALAPVHNHQLKLLHAWRRAEGELADRLVPRLLRTINAISSGLGATG